MKTHSGIRIDKIQVDGWAGLVFAVGILSLGLISLPPFRWLMLISLVGGGIGAIVVHLWHKYR